AALELYWTPALRTDLFGSITRADFNDTATTLFCTSAASPVKTIAGGTPPTTAGCNPDFTVWNVGARTIWNPAPQFDIGLEVMYTKVETNLAPGAVRFSNRPVGVKCFQTIHCCDVDVARGLVLLFGTGTKALPRWDSRTRRNNLSGGLTVTNGRSKQTFDLTSSVVPRGTSFHRLVELEF